MGSTRDHVRALYGAPVLHLLTMTAALALGVYTVLTLGLHALWGSAAWWQSIAVWFLGAVVVHDLVLFPLYIAADRLLHAGLGLRRRPATGDRRDVPVLNHVRVPALATALTFLLFFPGILEQGTASYARATGQTQEPFLGRWLLLTAGFFATSALAYGARMMRARSRHHGRPART